MLLQPTILATDLDAQVTSIQALLERRAERKKLVSPSRVHDRASLADLIRCAVAADALAEPPQGFWDVLRGWWEALRGRPHEDELLP